MIEWRAVIGFPRYEVSSEGLIRGPRGIMTPSWAKKYYAVGMYIDRKRHYKTVHSLVAAAFIGPRPKGYEVNHKNGVTTDNRIENLEYVTMAQNHAHASDTFLLPHGERNHASKLTDDKAIQIRHLHKDEAISLYRLAKMFGVTAPAIRQLILGNTWRHVL